jgi:hypothetical protein
VNAVGLDIIRALESKSIAIHNAIAALTHVFDLGISFDAAPSVDVKPEPVKPVRRKTTKHKPAKAKVRRIATPATADDRAPRQGAPDLASRRRLVLKEFKRHDMLTGKQLRKVVRFEGVADEQQTPALQNVLTWLRVEGYIDRTASTWQITDKGRAAEL